MRGGAGFSRYNDFDTENADTYYAGAGGRLDIGVNTAVNADLNTQHGVETRTEPTSAVSSAPVEYDVQTALLSVTHNFVRLSVSGDVSSSVFDYQNAAGTTFDQNLRDRTENAVAGRVEYAVSPRLFLLGQGRADNVEYDQAASQGENSDGLTLLAGVRVELNNLLRGTFSAGSFNRDYDNGRSVDGVALASDIDWFATPITTVHLHLSRDAEESSTASPLIQSRAVLRVDHELLRNLVVSGGVGYGTYDFKDVDRTDDVQTYEVGARYLMNRRVTLMATFNHNSTSSSGVDRYRDFDENRARLAVKFAL